MIVGLMRVPAVVDSRLRGNDAMTGAGGAGTIAGSERTQDSLLSG